MFCNVAGFSDRDGHAGIVVVVCGIPACVLVPTYVLIQQRPSSRCNASGRSLELSGAHLTLFDKYDEKVKVWGLSS